MNTKEQAERIKDLIGTLCERRKQLNFDDCDGKIDLDVLQKLRYDLMVAKSGQSSSNKNMAIGCIICILFIFIIVVKHCRASSRATRVVALPVPLTNETHRRYSECFGEGLRMSNSRQHAVHIL